MAKLKYCDWYLLPFTLQFAQSHVISDKTQLFVVGIRGRVSTTFHVQHCVVYVVYAQALYNRHEKYH